MRIAIATVQVPFVRGGAELLAEQLQEALTKRGHAAELILVPFKWYPPERILDHVLACRLLDLTESVGIRIDLLIGLKFPAFHIAHPNKVLWILHQHRQAYDLWDHPQMGDLKLQQNGAQVCAAIRACDEHLIPDAKAVYTISENVSSRLRKFSGIASTPIYHPPPYAESLFCAQADDYLFFPSRLNALKRQDVVIRALARTRERVRIRFAGAPDYPPYLNELKKLSVDLGVTDRIEWLGHIPNSAKAELYARCIGVVFPPVDEDYGYITLEAMLSSKPVITCEDSGGPKEFVVHGSTGYIVGPDPQAIAAAMDNLWADRSAAANMGRAAAERYREMNISWDTVTRALTS